MRSRRRPYDPERQLQLSDSWGLRECSSPTHQGHRILPADQFVKNGPYLRTVCRTCWAAENRARRIETPDGCMTRDAMLDLNRLWRPACDQRRRTTASRHRRPVAGQS